MTDTPLIDTDETEQCSRTVPMQMYNRLGALLFLLTGDPLSVLCRTFAICIVHLDWCGTRLLLILSAAVAP